MGFLRPFFLGLLLPPILRRVFRRRRRLAVDRAAALPPLHPPLPARYESMEPALWLSRAVAQLWAPSHAALAELIRSALLAPLLAENSPPPLRRPVEITRLALGSTAPSVHNVKTWRGRRSAVVIVDFDVDWVTSGFELVVGIGKAIPLVRAKELVYRGKMRLELHGKNDSVFELEKCGISAVERPQVDFSVEAIGAVEVMGVPKVSEWLTGFLEESVCDALLWPKQCVFHDVHNTGDSDIEDLQQQPGHDHHPDQASAPAEWTNKVMVANLLDAAPGEGFSPGTVGLLQIRLCEAAQLGHGDSAEKVLGQQDAVLNPYVAFKLGQTMKSSRRWKRTNSPSFDEVFEIPVTDPATELLEIKMYHEAEQVVDKVHALFKDRLLGSAWISVEEIAKEQGWVDLWLPLESGKLLPAEETNSGFLRLQLTYDVIHDPRDMKADEQLCQNYKTSEAGLASLSQHSQDTEPSNQTAGVWQIHLLEGSQWKKENVSQLVSDARCDIKCAGKTRRSKPCYDTKNPSWGEYFEIPVRDPLSDIVTISGVDEDPFAKEAYVGRALFALSEVGDVVPQEFWVQLRRRSSNASPCNGSSESSSSRSGAARCDIRVGGWIRVWIGFRSNLQDYATGDFTASTAEILINPGLSELRSRKPLPNANEAELNISPLHREEEHSITQSALLKSLEGLNPGYLLNLAERLPRSLVKYGHHVVWDKVIKNMLPPDESKETETGSGTASLARADSSCSFRSMTDVQSLSSLEADLFSTVTTIPESDGHSARPGSRLLASESSQVLVVTFVTGQAFRSGTKAKVWIDFRKGTQGHAIVVDRDRDTFARGACDRILMEIPKSIGIPSSIVVGHDNSGLSPSWFLESVTVANACPESPSDGWSILFPCHRWISVSSDSSISKRSALRARLYPVGAQVTEEVQ